MTGMCWALFLSASLCTGLAISLLLSNSKRMRRFKLQKIKYGLLREVMKPLIPSLELAPHHKGQHGRIAVIGGSEDYTGAPYYAGMSSLKFGSELAFIYCAKEAAAPIKSYSPELMVTSFYSSSDLEELSTVASNSSTYNDKVQSLSSKIIGSFPRFHSMVIGPGLGRNKYVLDIVTNIIRAAVHSNLPLVIDADGIYLLSSTNSTLLSTVLKGYRRCVLTPNAMEFENLVAYVVNNNAIYNSNEQTLQILKSKETSDVIRLKLLSNFLKLTILRKGATDYVSSGGDVFALASNVGSPRRCGGQGDILSGCLAAALHWCNSSAPPKYAPVDTRSASASPPPEQLLPDLSHLIERYDNRSSDDVQIFDLPDLPEELIDGEGRCNSMAETAAPILASLFASYITRKASQAAFEKSKRATLSTDIVNEIGGAMQSFEA